MLTTLLTAYLPTSLKPYAKALNAALAGIILYVLHSVVAGSWDLDALEAVVGTGLLAGVVFATPNDA